MYVCMYVCMYTELDQTSKRSLAYHNLPLRNPKRVKVFDKRTDYCIHLPI